MSTYSNAPSISGTPFSINRQNTFTGPWTYSAAPYYTSYLLLFTTPANSYAIIRGGILGGNTDTNVGLTVLDPLTGLASGINKDKINDATCLAYSSSSRDSDRFESIYLGPGLIVYAVAANSLGTLPSANIEVSLSGVLFTNGS